MPRHFSILLVGSFTVCCLSALGGDNTSKAITESALQESRDIISRGLLGHYDITNLEVQTIEDIRLHPSSEHDYGLIRVVLNFSTKRNATKHPNLNPDMFEVGNRMCQDWLYLHCGVPVGHVFDGKLEVLLAIDRNGAWRAVSPHRRSRTRYSLHGYLMLEGREEEGYVLFPRQQGDDGT